ncbi:GNAT family N-acetyltransferase [Clostridium sp.]|uniref:GNAT family N-acetyltransferase n=1 Tax=Clostridium sp. TaxID=1506 RepID=UPI002608D7AA|nr:GNAT family N-acetyltransferase [Clostridium sp.]
MNIVFEKMNLEHQKEIMEIFNFYVESGTAAFPNNTLPEPFYTMIMKKSEGYPSYALKNIDNNCVVGFCQLSPYNPFPTFKSTAYVTYFIANEYTGKGLGEKCLLKLEQDASEMGITNLVAEISSENHGSIAFHEKHDFYIAGELKNIGVKFNRKFGVVYMQKNI